ncbi:subunit of the ubiqunol-cytochrome c oxidoreductase complex, partial [Scheffersomyces stipitis CBS 6054]
QYIRGPVYKSIKSFAGFNAQNVRAYVPDLILWGGAAGAGVAVFTEGWPLFQKVFYQKIPVFGNHWIYNPDPEDIPL